MNKQSVQHQVTKFKETEKVSSHCHDVSGVNCLWQLLNQLFLPFYRHIAYHVLEVSISHQQE